MKLSNFKARRCCVLDSTETWLHSEAVASRRSTGASGRVAPSVAEWEGWGRKTVPEQMYFFNARYLCGFLVEFSRCKAHLA